MYLLTAVINNEELLDDLITGWLDIGISGSTVIESTDSLQLISHHVPIFAGFRVLTGGGMSRSKTLFTIIEEATILRQAVLYLKKICKETGKPHQGIYFVTKLADAGRLGLDVDHDQHKKHVQKKIGKNPT
ncbi:MAG: hypothetical protein KKD44_23845 [Proteobacteria bacterium]|nr:hypothetical protein [Pseudomonadota bacterium]